MCCCHCTPPLRALLVLVLLVLLLIPPHTSTSTSTPTLCCRQPPNVRLKLAQLCLIRGTQGRLFGGSLLHKLTGKAGLDGCQLPPTGQCRL